MGTPLEMTDIDGRIIYRRHKAKGAL
ncbi:hypothetical protein V2K62_11955 [Pseudomonas alliivorans]|nr:hypothetical protein [Pseudomonas alliivorans]MEE4925406.1 hypothetical protein [Pseudomonas alliivorans]